MRPSGIFSLFTHLSFWFAIGVFASERPTVLSKAATLNDLQGKPKFLPVDEAFRFSAWREGDKIKLSWRIAEGYYLYKHRFFVTGLQTQDEDAARLGFPEGTAKQDAYFGKVTAYYNQLELEVPLSYAAHTDASPGTTASSLLIQYQGCADAGLCYPPQKRSIQWQGETFQVDTIDSFGP